MSKDHTALPMQSLSIDEKAGHDPITGHRTPSVGTPGHSGMGAHPTNGILPGGGAKQDKKKVHPAVIIVLWIALSSSVIVYNK
nr:related to triose phosphate 3-phosphoglycerate phosphate translocator [Melanopsichium pennsylvanicum 4]